MGGDRAARAAAAAAAAAVAQRLRALLSAWGPGFAIRADISEVARDLLVAL
ncbi:MULTISPECIES: hypothetical protein [Sorangium]|uniref:hypothetical protein n=1 Tax=Sorangium TaxID=39643 RepID=UPI0013EC60DC|nr:MULTISPECIES: hypothetical protein [Sorangium]